MDVKYYPSDDIVSIVAAKQNTAYCEDLAYDWSVALGYAEEDSEEIAYLEIIGVSGWLKIGYDAETDTLLLGRDIEGDFRVVESGEFVNYKRWYDAGDGDGYWETVKMKLRNASRHFAEVFAHLESSPESDPAEGDGQPPDAG